MSTGVAPAATPTKQARIGSFSIVERLNPPDAIEGQITLKVAGLPDSSFAGREGLAVCFNAPQGEAARQRVDEMLSTLKNLAHPAIWPVMDTGTSGSIVFWVRSIPVGETLERVSPAPSIREVGQIVQAIAEGLQSAHEKGLSHGSIRPGALRRFPSGAWTLYGLGIMGRGPAADQFDLAQVAVTVLSGRPWQEPDLSAYPENEHAYHRGQRLREQLGNTTERVVNVINRAMLLDPTQRYATIAEFGDDLASQIRISGDDLVHGAFEAISARNVELARIMAAKAAVYNPESDNLAVLTVQLNGGSVFGQATAPAQPVVPGMVPTPTQPNQAWLPTAPAQPAATRAIVPEGVFVLPPQPGASAPSDPASLLTLPPMQAQTGPAAPAMPAELAHGLPPEMVEMFSAQFQPPPPKKGSNPMFVLILGAVGMVLLLLVAALVTFFASGM